jgi:hypothetical protein
MDEQIKVGEENPPIEVILLGQASKVTRGSYILFPWFEPSPPPYDRRCPTC